MSKLHFFQKLAPMGVVSLGAIAAIAGIGIAAAPAQALVFGNLGWNDGTDDFFDEVDFGDPNDTFDVEFFNPAIIPPVPFPAEAFISVSEEGFLDLGFTPGSIEPLTDIPVGSFAISEQAVGGNPNIARYQNTNDIVFHFEDGEIFTLNSGATFLGTSNGAVDFELDEAFPVSAEWFIPGQGTLRSPDVVFEFGQTSTSSAGVYNVEADAVHAAVPEPGTILGLLAVGGLGIAMKRKQQSKQLSA